MRILLIHDARFLEQVPSFRLSQDDAASCALLLRVRIPSILQGLDYTQAADQLKLYGKADREDPRRRVDNRTFEPEIINQPPI